MSDGEKNGETTHDLPLKNAFEHNFSGFRSQSRQRRGTIEKATSPLQALTEDSSAKFWSVYICEAERYDSALVESWKADMEGMLIFSGLFSASLTAFIIESYKNLIPDTGDTTVFLLSQLTQQLSAQSNGSHFAPSSPPAFETPTSSLLCNGFFFVSLGLSLTCALLATLVEQWAREFLHKTERVHSPVRRARVFSFLYYGVSRFGIHAIVDIIPLLLHLGLVLFFAGLAVFLLPINSIMAGIVTSVLVVFITFYVIITVLPVISLDCPYRTPFSDIFWRIVQYLAMVLNLPSTGRNLTDEVLAAAMQRRDIRDERAVLWTLEALTDNNELLPFVEATHEIIDGPTGLRRVDDYLFRLVLQTEDPHTSLPRRILSLLWSAETLPLNDPLRDRRQIAGLRALWALGIVTARIARAPASEVYGINRTGLYALRIPATYRLSLEAVITYVYLKSIQTRFEDIESMFSSRDLSIPRERRRLVQSLRSMISGLEHDCKRAGMALEVETLLRILEQFANSDCDDPESALETAKQVMERMHSGRMISWPMHYSKIVIRLVDAAFREGVAPYRMLPTCKEVFPGVLAAPGQLLPLETFLGKGPEVLPPSLHVSLGDASQNDLDTIMRCGLRLLPLLDPTTFLPTIYWYLSNLLDVLAEATLAGTTSGAMFVDADWLRGISRLCLWSNKFAAVLDCDSVLANVEAKQNRSPSEFPTVKAILSARVLVTLGTKLRIGGASPHVPPDPRTIQEIAAHSLIQGTDVTDLNNWIPEPSIETHDQLVRRLCERYAAEVIAFLSSCTSPVQLPYMAEATVIYLQREWDLFLNVGMSARTQRQYARAVLTLFECAYDENHPQQGGIYSIAQALSEVDPESKLARTITDLESIGLLARARRSPAEWGVS
ncbi:hypothetical protein MVEN_00493400 [Mycena venus]|uniref:DUF6535 domain-containing protein n=1 Tax=Mycena venus TaxID=2733690 RepID=A0A8H6YVW0_9AGAR|nr:hypothetical protein MVEN_00493400 [Mycena venus]